jgi:hypothetical protein
MWGDHLTPVLRRGRFRPIRQRELLRLREVPRLPAGQRTAVSRRKQLAARHAVLHGFEIGDDVPASELSARIAASRHCLLRGYFQNERYFIGAAAEVRASFRPVSPDVSRFVAWAGGGSPTVGISMRTGADYGEFGWTLDRGYYLRAAERLRKLVEDPSFAVFGDVPEDAEWLVGQLAAAGGRAVLAANLAAADQLFAMAAMDHLVISNSSFAWWGAWLGDGRPGDGRVVIRPSQWVPGVTDICPDRWQPVDAEFARQT